MNADPRIEKIQDFLDQFINGEDPEGTEQALAANAALKGLAADLGAGHVELEIARHAADVRGGINDEWKARHAQTVEALERAREALEPFADQFNWHHNYDGHGIIFQIEGTHSQSVNEKAIEAARAALAADTDSSENAPLQWGGHVEGCEFTTETGWICQPTCQAAADTDSQQAGV